MVRPPTFSHLKFECASQDRTHEVTLNWLNGRVLLLPSSDRIRSTTLGFSSRIRWQIFWSVHQFKTRQYNCWFYLFLAPILLLHSLVSYSLSCRILRVFWEYLPNDLFAEGDHESRNHDWNEVYSPTQLEVEAKQATDAEPEVTESQSNIQFSEAKLHEHDLSTYPRPVESPTFVPANLSKDQYHLLTRTVDTRRRNMPRDLQSQEPLVDSRSLVSFWMLPRKKWTAIQQIILH